MKKMAAYGSLMLLLVGLELAFFDPTPLEQLTINLDLPDTPDAEPRRGPEEFEDVKDLKAGQTTIIVPVVIGGVGIGGIGIVGSVFYNNYGPWIPMGVFAPPRQGLAAANLNNELYMAGGKTDLNPNITSERIVQKLNRQNGTNRWENDSNLRTGRTYFTLNRIRNELGAITLMATGGITRGVDTPLRTTEIYLPVSKVWKYFPPMLKRRFGHAAAYLPGKLYVFGGKGVNTPESTEVFDFSTKTWSFGPSLNHLRAFHAATVLGGHIYTCGGEYGRQFLISCEKFDGNRWDITMTGMQRRRSEFGMFTMGNLIWAIGGSSDMEKLDSVEVYDKRSDSWNEQSKLKLPSPRFLFGMGSYNIGV